MHLKGWDYGYLCNFPPSVVTRFEVQKEVENQMPYLAVIGADGGVGKAHVYSALQLASQSNFTVLGCVRNDARRLSLQRGSSWGDESRFKQLNFWKPPAEVDTDRLETVGSLEDVIESRPIGVIVATPLASHFDIAKELLNAKIPVLCEKLLCPSCRQADQLVSIAESQGTTLMTVLEVAFFPQYEWMLQTMHSGDYGRAQCFIGARRIGVSDPCAQRENSEIYLNPVADLGCHDVSVANEAFGAKPLSVTARNCDFSDGFLFSAVLELEYPGNRRAELTLGRRADGDWKQSFCVTSDKGAECSYDSDAGPGVAFAKDACAETEHPELEEVHALEPFKRVQERFLAAAEGRQKPGYLSGENGACTVQVMEAAVESAKNSGRRIEI